MIYIRVLEMLMLGLYEVLIETLVDPFGLGLSSDVGGEFISGDDG